MKRKLDGMVAVSSVLTMVTGRVLWVAKERSWHQWQLLRSRGGTCGKEEGQWTMQRTEQFIRQVGRSTYNLIVAMVEKVPLRSCLHDVTLRYAMRGIR